MRWQIGAIATIAVVAIVGALGVVTACSSSTTTPPGGGTSSSGPEVVDGITVPPAYVAPPITVAPGVTTCPAPFLTTLSAAAHGGRFVVTTQGAAHLITCRYHDPQATRRQCSGASILINTEAQAFWAFNRWDVEAGQNSMWGSDPATRPTPVSGLGILAEWVPELLELGVGNTTTWISVTLTCGSGNTPAVLRLAKRLAREGLAATA